MSQLAFPPTCFFRPEKAEKMDVKRDFTPHTVPLVIKWTFYLQKFEAPKLLSVYYSDYSLNILCKYKRKVKLRF